MKQILSFALIILLGMGCNSDEFSPNQKFNRGTPVNVNAKEIVSLPKKSAGTPIKIAVPGDTQRTDKESKDFVDYWNTRNDIDFVILNGDISDFGLLLEFNANTNDLYPISWFENRTSTPSYTMFKLGLA